MLTKVTFPLSLAVSAVSGNCPPFQFFLVNNPILDVSRFLGQLSQQGSKQYDYGIAPDIVPHLVWL